MKIKTTLLALILIASLENVIALNDTLTVKLKLKSTNNVLTFNQPHVNPNDLEYLWEIKIDSDNNQLTGDNFGYDVGLSISNTKFGTSLSYTGTIISGSQQNTVIYSNNTATYGNELFVWFDDSDTSLMIKGLRDWPELAGINAGDRMIACSYFNGKDQKEYDYTPSSAIPAPIMDSSEDVASNFIDIISVTIQDIPLGNSETLSAENRIEVYPNPSSGIINVTEADLPIAIMDIHIFNSSGETVKSCSEKVMDLTHLSPGLYYIKIKKQTVMHQVIINH